MIQYQPKKSFHVDGRPIHVFDNLISKTVINETYMALKGASFTLTEIARPDVEEYRHWAHNMPLELTQKFQLAITANNVMKNLFKDSYRVYRSYCNVARYGDMLYPHTDCMPEAKEMTALWFVQDEWDYEWGGETLFYNKENDAEVVLTPKPGRLAIFDGAICHAGNPPNKICTKPRYTFALKYEKY
jgi:hypothetical protein